MNFQELETERLILKVLTPEVYQFVFKNYNDSELLAFFSLESKEDLLKEKLNFKKGISTFNKSFLNFNIIDKASNQIIGWCGYHLWFLDHHRAEIGYKLMDDKYKRKGLMSEALSKVVKYGFESMKLNRIEAFVGPDNVASLKLIDNLGFTKEGHLRSHYLRDGEYEDSLVFSLLKKDFNI